MKDSDLSEPRHRRESCFLCCTHLSLIDYLCNRLNETGHMIDTIILTVPNHMFQIAQPELFEPSAAWAMVLTTKARHTSKQNPTKKELLAGIYKPRLTLSSRINHYGTLEIILKIELSLPKLMFGNNFAELQYKDFIPLSRKLATTLDSMGIIITPEALRKRPFPSSIIQKTSH